MGSNYKCMPPGTTVSLLGLLYISVYIKIFIRRFTAVMLIKTKD